MTSNRILYQKIAEKDRSMTQSNICMAIMYVASFAAITNPSLAIITGPIIAATMTLLFLKDKFYSVVALVVLANDSIGTVVLGKGSFYWFLILLILIKSIIQKKSNKISVNKLTNLYVVLIMLLQFWFSNEASFRSIFQTLIFVFFLIYTWNEIQTDSEKVKDFFFHIALTIFIIALSTVVFGGVVFMEGYTERLGIRGVGTGDPNFSALILNTGIAIMLAQNYRSRIIRIGMILVMIAAMVQTVSITGLLCFLALLTCYFLVGMRLPKAASSILMFFLLVTFVFQYYNTLPDSDRNPNIDFYILRTEEKLNAFSNKDYKHVTTGRTSNTEQNIKYFSSQSVGKKLFGGNPTPPEGVLLAHNTYVDILLRFGWLGSILFYYVTIIKLWNSFRLYNTTKKNGEVFLLKVIFVLFSGTLSIYSGNIFALWYMILIML